MPIGAILRLTLTAQPSPETVILPVTLRSRNEDLQDFVNLTLTVTHELADAVASSYRLLGIQIEMDDGAGLRTLTRGEVGRVVGMHASLDQIGRTLTFSRLLPNGSPLTSNLLRGMRRIRVTGYLGTSPATMQARVLFDGNLLTAPFSGYPPVAQITAQDASVLYAAKQLSLDIPEGSGRTRLSIFTDVASATGITRGSWDLGPNNGGIVKKAMSVGGDQNVLEWFRSAITPLGKRLRFNPATRVLDIGSFNEAGVVARNLTASDINNLVITPPGTPDANRVSMSGTAVVLRSEALTGIDDGNGGISSGMVVTTVAQMGDYTPQTATRVQDKDTGDITETVLPPAAHSPLISQTVTSTNIEIDANRNVTVTEIVDKYGFYAQRACQFHITNSAGDLSWNSMFDVYLFPDGSARAVTVETYQHLSQTETVKVYVNGTLRSRVIREAFIDPDATNPYTGTWTSGTNILVTAQREQWLNDGKDVYTDPARNTYETHTVAADGVHLVSIFQTIDSFTGQTGTIFSGFTYQNTGDPSTGQLAETLQSSDHAEQIDSLQKAVNDPQSLTAVVTDTVRQGLTTTITAYQQNDFCENLAELTTAALFALRELAKTRIEFDMPVDFTLQDGAVFTLPIPIVGSGSDPIVVGEINWQIDGGNAQNSQRVTGWWPAPNLRAA